MQKKKQAYFIITLCLPVIITAIFLLAKVKIGENTSIRISDSRNEFCIAADFPVSKSKRVQDYLYRKLHMSDLPDLSYVEIEHYQTPDKLMNLSIKSRSGYVKILLGKTENDAEAYTRIKKTGEGLKELLAQ